MRVSGIVPIDAIVVWYVRYTRWLRGAVIFVMEVKHISSSLLLYFLTATTVLTLDLCLTTYTSLSKAILNDLRASQEQTVYSIPTQITILLRNDFLATPTTSDLPNDTISIT